MKQLLLLDFAHFVIDEFTAHKTLIAFIVIGMVSGLVAQLILPGRGFGLVATAVIGIAGCYLGNLFITDHLTFIQNHVVRELAGAIIGSMVLSLAINLVRGKEK